MTRDIVCPQCQGTGFIEEGTPGVAITCDECDGFGLIDEQDI